MTFLNIADVRRANKAKGHHWFDKATMEFFASRIESRLIAGRYFITSEKTGFDDETRAFSVRVAHDDGSINTLSEFQEYADLDAARAAVRLLAKTEAR